MPTETIQEIAIKALEGKKVDLVIGFTPGTRPLTIRPAFIDDPSAVKKLVWNDFCAINPAKYLLKHPKRVGIIANGCISRSIVMYIMEKQIERRDIYIIGVPCAGMLDKYKINAFWDKKKKKSLSSESGRVLLSGDGQIREYPRHMLLRQNCLSCRHKNPVIYDILAGKPVDENEQVTDPDIEALEALPTPDRLQYFRSIFSTCKLCYACRNACPICYCPTCFAERPDSQWAGKQADRPDPLAFHLLRAMHCAGRCTDCGACENACPAGIPLTKLTRKLNKDIRLLYHFEAGLNIETPLPFSVYNLEDPQEFMLTEELKKTARVSAV